MCRDASPRKRPPQSCAEVRSFWLKACGAEPEPSIHLGIFYRDRPPMVEVRGVHAAGGDQQLVRGFGADDQVCRKLRIDLRGSTVREYAPHWSAPFFHRPQVVPDRAADYVDGRAEGLERREIAPNL